MIRFSRAPEHRRWAHGTAITDTLDRREVRHAYRVMRSAGVGRREAKDAVWKLLIAGFMLGRTTS